VEVDVKVRGFGHLGILNSEEREVMELYYAPNANGFHAYLGTFSLRPRVLQE